MFNYRLKCLILVGFFYGFSLAQEFNNIIEFKSFANIMNESLSMQEVSFDCKLQIGEYVKGLKLKNLWALKMFDAAAKPPSGILEGNLIDLGSFDECLKVEKIFPNKATIFGKYCLPTIAINVSPKLQFPQSKWNFEIPFGDRKSIMAVKDREINFKMSTCIPNACSANDIRKIYEGLGFSITLSDELCQTKDTQPKIGAGGIATLSFFAVVLCIIITSTIYDTITFYLKKKPLHPMLIAFSVLTNGKKILATSSNPNEISCLHGIRVISTMWVILGHRYVIQSIYPVKYFSDVVEWISDQANMFILGATVSVDTFFLMAGMIISYLYMTTTKEFNIILYYIHRYLRLTPALAIVILIHVTLLEWLGSGPIWPYNIKPALINSCEKAWWKVLLYIQNYGNLQVCVPQSWYLAVDMQLFILSPILLLPMKKWPTLTMLATGFLTFLSILSCFLTAWFYELNGSMIGNKDVVAYVENYYFPTWTRAAPWLIGIMLGYFIFKVKQKRPLIMNKVLVLCTWTVSLVILSTCVFVGHSLSSKDYSKLENSFYIALVRPAWSVAIAWVVFACLTGYGGPVNWFLSLPIFQVVSKFTYSLYLVHYTVIHLTTLQMRQPPILSNAREMYIFWGDFAITFLAAVILTLAFESPIITIEKCIFDQPKKEKRSKQVYVNQDKPKLVEIA